MPPLKICNARIMKMKGCGQVVAENGGKTTFGILGLRMDGWMG